MLKVRSLSDVARRVKLSHYTVLVSRKLMPHSGCVALLARPVIDGCGFYVYHGSVLLHHVPVFLEQADLQRRDINPDRELLRLFHDWPLLQNDLQATLNQLATSVNRVYYQWHKLVIPEMTDSLDRQLLFWLEV